MKIALFSDIHANLPALQAFFASVEQQQPDAFYCLGDLVGYNTWPNEVINEICRRGIPTIAGNYDFGVGRSGDDCGCAYKTDEEKANGAVSISYTNQVVRDEERAYLRTLPAHIRVEFQLNNDKLNLLLVHGSSADKDSIRVEFVRFDYDIEKAARAIEASPLPRAFADALRVAR